MIRRLIGALCAIKTLMPAVALAQFINFLGIDPAGAAGALTKIAAVTASNSATIDFTGLTSTYGTVILVCSNLINASNSVSLNMRVGEGGGPTWEAASYDWRFDAREAGVTTAFAATANGSDAQIQLTPATIDHTITQLSTSLWATINLGQGSSTLYKNIEWSSTFWDSGGNNWNTTGLGAYFGDSNAFTGVRVFFNPGNITSGTCTLYGLTP